MQIPIGTGFGQWSVVGSAPPQDYSYKSVPRWLCRCACGTERIVRQPSLRNGSSQSCGCLHKEACQKASGRHGETFGGKASSEYATWQAMLARCRNPKNPRYDAYGGRGIMVCERWLVFENFLKDMGRRPSPRHSLERIDNDKGYEPGNCRWALPHEQMTNRRITRFVDVDGKQVPLATLAHFSGIPANTLRARILNGWSVERATGTPVRYKAPNGTAF